MADLHAIDPIDKSEDVIATLERALEKAREGDVASVAVCFVYRDGSTGQLWSFQRVVAMMIGCAQILIAKLVQDALEPPGETVA